MLKEGLPTDEVFSRSFYSPEGWYSQILLKTKSMKVKIVGRSFDDFSNAALLKLNGKLFRCDSTLFSNLTSCVTNFQKKFANISNVYSIPQMQVC
jgi:hypothetical protein